MTSMKLDKHIANAFLTNDNFVVAMLNKMHPEQFEELSNPEVQKQMMLPEASVFPIDHLLTSHKMLNSKNQKAYFITKTVFGSLDMIKVKRQPDNGDYDWTVFSEVTEQKITTIQEDNSCIRIVFLERLIQVCHLYLDENKKAKWVIFYIDRETNEQCDHFFNEDVPQLQDIVYKFLCFFFLSKHEFKIIPVGGKEGTKKNGKIINLLPFPITMVTSNWNTTTIRTHGFSVKGHFAIRRTGVGRTGAKLVYIEPFEKTRYIRRAQKHIESRIS